MSANFLQAAGTNGLIASAFNLLSTELNSLASGAAVTSSVGGSSGKFTQTDIANAIWGAIVFNAGGAFTPGIGGFLAGWFLLSLDGGSTYEAAISTPSTTVPALPRSPDFVIALDNVAHASGSKRWCQGRRISLPAENFKVVLQNNSGVALPSSGNLISLGATAIQY